MPTSAMPDREATAPDPTPYDALLLVSFGGPERPEDVVPFLENVTRGRGIPPERLAEVGSHYFRFGGRSPINDLNREFLVQIRADFAAAGVELPVYWGNRNWDPFLADTVAQMAADGVTRAACFVTSAFSSYSSCRQYRENLTDAAAVPGAPRLDRLRGYFNHPGFVEPNADAVLAALADLPESARQEVHVAFVTHSLPEAANATSGPRGGLYVRQHHVLANEIIDRVLGETGRRLPHALVYCSRSGSPAIPWLEPDINDHIEELAKKGATGVIVAPIGFVSDHMEVVFDLDTQAVETAERVGLPVVRAATAGLDPRFVAVVRDLLLERAAVERGEDPLRAAVGPLPALPDLCAAGCCPNPRAARPALGGLDS